MLRLDYNFARFGLVDLCWIIFSFSTRESDCIDRTSNLIKDAEANTSADSTSVFNLNAVCD